jgi:CBS domain containing-hemolysin-like protein
MEIPLSLLFLFIALFISFLSGIITSLTKDEIQALSLINPHKASRLSKVYFSFDEKYNEFQLFELFFGIFSIIFLFLGYLKFNINTSYLLYWLILVFPVYYFIHSLLFAYGERKSNRYALKFSFIIYLNHLLGKPIISPITKLTRLIKGVTESEESINEINELFETAREEGSLDEDEYKLLKNIMSFSDVLVTDVMTPRTVIFSCNAENKVSDVINNVGLQTYSRIPIWGGESLDDKIVGYVLSKDVFKAALNNQTDILLKNFARDVYIIPETADLSIALEKFLKRRQHLFIVVDEYGSVSGLITMEDVMETILGVEILDEADRVTDLRKFAAEKRDARIKSNLA